MTDELDIIPEILNDAVRELRLRLAHPAFHSAYTDEQRVHLEVLTAQMDAVLSELETASKQGVPPRPKLAALCDGCGHDYAHCACPAGRSMARTV
jgi:hypothetical protein